MCYNSAILIKVILHFHLNPYYKSRIQSNLIHIALSNLYLFWYILLSLLYISVYILNASYVYEVKTLIKLISASYLYLYH